MKYNPTIHNRCSIRLKGYDYSSNGAYFVTICTEKMKNLFGSVNDGKISLNLAGKMVDGILNKLEDEFDNIQIDKYVIMPNHLHVIIIINHHINQSNTVGADSMSALNKQSDKYVGADSISAQNYLCDSKSKKAHIECAPTLGKIVQSFKRQTTIEYIKGVKQKLHLPFNKRIWQRNYYDHIVRDETDYQKIWNYIDQNPLKWELDQYYNKLNTL